ncbi:hypothetical protein [Chroococcidiopsis sp. CCMEE 29]|uniref:hypothetical protein n=1 Tax=Chroococcidiopsis sp. CCMEE 29 TaxID=155894 RepID=UPI0020202A0B|nr:hypothetical protein [Chroococcidiopsis sp. CCMEE 29]
MNLSDLDSLPLPEPSPGLAERIMSYIALDPENLFRETYIEDHPEVNFAALARLQLEGMSWQEISENFGIPSTTISRFYQSCLLQFVPTIKEHLENLENT